jgi:hypothetical protein
MKVNYATQDQHEIRYRESHTDGNSEASSEVLELFAEDLPVQHDLKASQCLSTTSTISTFGGCAGTVGTLGCVASL